MRKSQQLKLTFPYDWSNPAISDEALIVNVLQRGIYEDICRVCAYYGVETVEQVACRLQTTQRAFSPLPRMLLNIKTGFAHAQAQ